MSGKPKDKNFKKVTFQGKQFYQCTFCYRNFARFDLLTCHIKSRESNYPFQCEVCCEKRQKEVLLKYHIKKYHIKMKKASGKGSKSQKRQNESKQNENENETPSQRARMGNTNILVSPGISTSCTTLDSQGMESLNSSSKKTRNSQEDEEMELVEHSSKEIPKIPEEEAMDTLENSNNEMSGSEDHEAVKADSLKQTTEGIVESHEDEAPDNDTIPDLEPNNNDLIFKLWALLPLNKEANSDCSEQEKLAIKVLQGTIGDEDVEKLVKCLDAGMESSFGTFISSIIVVSVFKKAKVELLLSNYDRLCKVKFSLDLKFVMTELMLGIFRTKRIELYKSKTHIPEDIASVIFGKSDSQANPINNDITVTIMQSIYNFNPDFKFFDNKVIAQNRVKMWCKIYQSWCDHSFEINNDFISIICIDASKMGITTDVTVILNDKDKLYLHSDAFEKTLGTKITKNSVKSDITNQDFKKIAGLLYGKGSIPKGGYRCEMLDLLIEFGCNSEKIYSFLFKDKSSMEDCFSTFEYDNLLYFVIKLRKIKADKSNFSKWNVLFKAGCVMSKIEKFTEKDVNYMFGKDGFELGDVDIYKFLVLWSTGNSCQFENIRVKDFEKGKEKFQNVKGLIKDIAKLKNIFDIVCLHGFLDISEYL